MSILVITALIYILLAQNSENIEKQTVDFSLIRGVFYCVITYYLWYVVFWSSTH